MNTKRIEVAEHVLPGHPDKLCDAAVDTIVDFVQNRDPLGQCGLEASCVFDTIHLTGRIAAREHVVEQVEEQLEKLVRQTYDHAGYGVDPSGYLWGPHPEDIKVSTNFCLGAFKPGERENRHLSDDQAICVGYANNNSETGFLPPAQYLARKIAYELFQLRRKRGVGHVGPDGKVIVRVEVDGHNWRPVHVSLSINHHESSDWLLIRQIGEEAVHKACRGKGAPTIRLNNAGSFVSGGPNGDNGLSGKKLVVDAYGPTVPIGGGAWSGKDFNKVDRAGGLLARQLAREFVASRSLNEAQVTLEYIPGCEAPVYIEVLGDGQLVDVDQEEWLSNSQLFNKNVSRRYTRKRTVPYGDPSLSELALWGHQAVGYPWERGLRRTKPEHRALFLGIGEGSKNSA